MKRTAAAFVLVAGVAGMTGCNVPSGKTNTTAQPIKDVQPVGHMGGVQQASGYRTAGAPQAGDVVHAAVYNVDKVTSARGIRQVTDKYPAEVFGPTQYPLATMMGHGGITPVPSMGPPGAVALVPGAAAMGGGMDGEGMYANGRTSVRFASPAGMKIAFMTAGGGFGDAGREAPVRYNFVQGNIYRIRLNGIPNRPGKNYYPTLELYPATRDTVTFLSHSTVPVGFTDEDFEQVNAGNMVVKVIYLPSAAFQDVALAEEIVSTRLEPGADPIAEANRRGTILAVIRMGNIDLEDPTTPAMDAPPGGMMAPGMAPMMAPSAPAAASGSGLSFSSPSTKKPADLPKIEPKPIDIPSSDTVSTDRTPVDLPKVSLPKLK